MANNDDYLWNSSAHQDPEVRRIEDALRPLRITQPAISFDKVLVRRPPRGLWAAAAAIALLAGGYTVARARVEPWNVRALSGSATVASARVDANAGIEARIDEGEWLETDAQSRAQMNVGGIGRAEFGPGSRVQVVRAGVREHRLALARGTMHARIWAPPRFFLVQTASALAVDLGCVYTLTMDSAGFGELSVQSGQVELVEGTRRAFVPAGNVVSVRPSLGPGLPIPERSPPAFREAVLQLERDIGNEIDVARVLDRSTPDETITLWHLLQRVEPSQRGAVLDRLIMLAGSAPEGVSPEAAMALDARALTAWRELLDNRWNTETVAWWKRAWRKTWTFLLTVG
jgi:hypothetical protein